MSHLASPLSETQHGAWLSAYAHLSQRAIPEPPSSIATTRDWQSHSEAKRIIHEWLCEANGVCDYIRTVYGAFWPVDDDVVTMTPTNELMSTEILDYMARFLTACPRWDRQEFWQLVCACAARAWCFYHLCDDEGDDNGPLDAISSTTIRYMLQTDGHKYLTTSVVNLCQFDMMCETSFPLVRDENYK